MHECFVIGGVPASDFVSSYMMKCKAFECVSDTIDFEETVRVFSKRDLTDDAVTEASEVLR